MPDIDTILVLLAGVVAQIPWLVYLRRRRKPDGSSPAGAAFYFARVTTEAGTSIEGVIETMNLKSGQRVTVTARFRDRHQNAASVQPGSAAWTSSDESIATVSPLPEEPDQDGNVKEVKAVVTSVGPVGAAQINLDADGDLGDGVKSIQASGAANVIAGDAAVAELEFGTPEDEQP